MTTFDDYIQYEREFSGGEKGKKKKTWEEFKERRLQEIRELRARTSNIEKTEGQIN